MEHAVGLLGDCLRHDASEVRPARRIDAVLIPAVVQIDGRHARFVAAIAGEAGMLQRATDLVVIEPFTPPGVERVTCRFAHGFPPRVRIISFPFQPSAAEVRSKSWQEKRQPYGYNARGGVTYK